VRTTLVIDDALLRRAKAHAGRHGLTLSALVERALREQLRAEDSAREGVAVYRVPTFGGGSTMLHEPAELTDALLDDDALALRRGRRR
jgi:hypothetical protein